MDVCVPTGNFGNILAAYYAKRIGVPIGRLLCASNSNNVLDDFIATGVYDIAVAFARQDAVAVHGHPRLVQPRTAAVRAQRRPGAHPPAGCRTSRRRAASRSTTPTLGQAAREFVGAWVDNDTCLEVIGRVYASDGYLLDPHTAVAWEVAERLARRRAGAHRQHRALEQVRGGRGARPHRRARRRAGAGAVDDLELLDRVVDGSHPARACRRSCRPCATAGGASTRAWRPTASRSRPASATGSPAPDADGRPTTTTLKETP